MKCASDKMYSFLKEKTFLWDLVIGRKSSSFYKVDIFNITHYEGIYITTFKLIHELEQHPSVCADCTFLNLLFKNKSKSEHT